VICLADPPELLLQQRGLQAAECLFLVHPCRKTASISCIEGVWAGKPDFLFQIAVAFI
jgi:hypothetical protein